MNPNLPTPRRVRSPDGSTPGSQESAAERLLWLWEQKKRPDLDALLAAAGPLSPDELAEVLRLDQRQRWERGERIPAEDYLARYPALGNSPEAALDLIYGEFLLRE